jgi:hypothetical protein
MKIWKQVLIATAAILMLGTGANLVATAAGSNDSPGVVDISGPCDEAEHANDPRCTGVTVPAAGDRNDGLRVDISGPCDEAEHANDPRCTGLAADADDSGRSDDSGPGNRDEDNSDPGNGDDDDSDDNSGPGNRDDDDEDD